MSVTDRAAGQHKSGNLRCAHCNAILPEDAAFCSACGTRLSGEGNRASFDQDITERYRITSLIRRQPRIRLFRAIDNKKQRPVIIRDIDVTHLDEQEQERALKAVQNEHNLLLRLNITDLLPFVDLRSHRGHIFSVSERPGAAKMSEAAAQRWLYTLEDLLQSGLGLPDEQIAIAWIFQLCQVLKHLHAHGIVIGTLDPRMLIVSTSNYHGWLMLTPAWLPRPLRSTFRTVENGQATHFCAPESLRGDLEPASDVYSLGAILYLLLTGTAPEDTEQRKRHPLLNPRELDRSVSPDLDTVVMRALALERTERYQSVEELAEALLHPPSVAKPVQHATPPLRSKSEETPDTAGTTNTTNTTHTADTAPAKAEMSNRERITRDLRHLLLPLQAYWTRVQQQSRYLSGKLKQESAAINQKSGQSSSSAASLNASKPQDEQMANTAADDIEKEPTIRLVNASQAPTPSQPFPVGPEINIYEDSAGSGEQDTAPVPVVRTIESSQAEQAEQTSKATHAEEVQERPATAGSEGEPTQIISRQAEIAKDASQAPEIASQPENTEDCNKSEESREEETLHIQKTASSAAKASEPAHIPSEASVQEQKPRPVREALSAGTDETVVASARPPEREAKPQASPLDRLKRLLSSQLSALAGLAQRTHRQVEGQTQPATKAYSAFLERLRRFILGEQQHDTAAAALIETPLRIQPDRAYVIRIHIMGRNERQGERCGLSGLVQGETVHIEVRSALPHHYAYVVQQADVQVPAQGFAAEVTMPMRPLSSESDGRRERLHILFMDEQGHPLYEKPFVIEIFVSHLVQAGREGYNVLPIPL
ncbi:MAG: hypothetical protein IMW89_12785 [Ktedonobacteraceae bacterium]|nr:hypothetical protein [Ktedonobacteraceae bacterium]